MTNIPKTELQKKLTDLGGSQLKKYLEIVVGGEGLLSLLKYEFITSLFGDGPHRSDRTDIPIIQQGQEPSKGIIIEDGVWLGADVKILDGVTVGRDSIIGTGAVVTKDIPPFSIAVGIPAEVVKQRK